MRITLDLDLDERAKFHALGGAAWARRMLEREPMPLVLGERSALMLTAAERADIIASDRPHKVLARKYSISPETVRGLRYAERQRQLRAAVVRGPGVRLQSLEQH